MSEPEISRGRHHYAKRMGETQKKASKHDDEIVQGRGALAIGPNLRRSAANSIATHLAASVQVDSRDQTRRASAQTRRDQTRKPDAPLTTVVQLATAAAGHGHG